MADTIKKSLFILGLTLIFYFICVLWIDFPLTQFINNHSGTFWHNYSIIFSTIFTPKWIFCITFVFLVIAVIGLLTKKFNSSLLNYLTSYALITVISYIIVTILKIAIGRARPFMWINGHTAGFSPFINTYDYFSSPSGHIFITTALVFVVFGLTQKVWVRVIALLCLASVVLARIVLLKHFLGDCIFSIGLTWACFEYRIVLYNKVMGLASKGELKTNY